jgi:hypothetical protein
MMTVTNQAPAVAERSGQPAAVALLHHRGVRDRGRGGRRVHGFEHDALRSVLCEINMPQAGVCPILDPPADWLNTGVSAAKGDELSAPETTSWTEQACHSPGAAAYEAHLKEQL